MSKEYPNLSLFFVQVMITILSFLLLLLQSAIANVDLFFGIGEGTILAASGLYAPDRAVQDGDPLTKQGQGMLDCVRIGPTTADGCYCGFVTGAAFVEVRLKAPTSGPLHVVWEAGGGHGRGTSFQYKATSADNWQSLIPTVERTTSDWGDVIVDVGAISDVKYQCEGNHWCKIIYFNVYADISQASISKISCTADIDQATLQATNCDSTLGSLTVNLVVDHSDQYLGGGESINSIKIGAKTCAIQTSSTTPIPESDSGATRTALSCTIVVTDIYGEHTKVHDTIESSNFYGHYVEVLNSNGNTTFVKDSDQANQARLFFQKPIVTSVIGDTTVTGGKLFQIIGSGFGIPQTQVSLTIGELNVTAVTWVSPTEITFISPKLSLKSSINMTFVLTVEDVEQQNEWDFAYSPPIINTVQMIANKPGAGQTGVQMTLIGSEFADVTWIDIYTDKGAAKTAECGRIVHCTDINRISYNEIKCILPQEYIERYGCVNEQTYVTISEQTSQQPVQLCYPEEGSISGLSQPKNIELKRIGEYSMNVSWSINEEEKQQLSGFQIQLSNLADFSEFILYDSHPNTKTTFSIQIQNEVTSDSRSQLFSKLPKRLWEQVIYVQIKSLQVPGVSTDSVWSSPSSSWTIGTDCKYTAYLRDISATPIDWQCQPCPAGASCAASTPWLGVRALFGYYRVPYSLKISNSNSSTIPRNVTLNPDPAIFEECLLPGACLGASNPEFGKMYFDLDDATLDYAVSPENMTERCNQQ